MCRSRSSGCPAPAADGTIVYVTWPVSSVLAWQMLTAKPAAVFYTVRSISLPVYRRLLRDQHSHGVCLQQALLHLLAWKSDSPWARQQAQRLLWQGGVLGDKGEFALMTLDDELRERQIEWPGLWSLLAVTGFSGEILCRTDIC
ncbi:membrane protein [Salmonella enterica subsp. enterica]|uniref:2-(5''-triphosphoribosyl)-3'-dephosphocoenzyme-A synthase n=1 Tax=Salmonella enterica I TaxID=59201 RepID=A0A3S5DDD5_SALET|nr:membrane protein [Salmonella enterica subsp. enterica]